MSGAVQGGRFAAWFNAEEKRLGIGLCNFEEGVLMHTCEDGHTWREQPDGGVAPSWGGGALSIHYDGWLPRCCPEPERFEVPYCSWTRDDAVMCPVCRSVGLAFDLIAPCSCSPWELYEEAEVTGHLHSPPAPICGKPPVETRAWRSGGRLGAGNWVPLDDAGQVAEAGAQLDFFGVAA